MKQIDIEQLKRIQTKKLLGLALSAFEQAYYTLYGNRLSEEN